MISELCLRCFESFAIIETCIRAIRDDDVTTKMILIAGFGGAGKSTFASELGKHLGLPFFCKDRIKEVMGDGYGPQSGEVYSKGSNVTLMLMLYIAERFLEQGQTCILESNFRRSDRAILENLLARFDAECLTFVMGGDLAILWERYQAREASGARHWVHKKVVCYEDYVRYHRLGGHGEFSLGKTDYVDTSQFDRVDYAHLIERARRFIDCDEP